MQHLFSPVDCLWTGVVIPSFTVTHSFINSSCGLIMFEFERYVHDVNNRELLSAYLYRVALRIDVLKVIHGIS